MEKLTQDQAASIMIEALQDILAHAQHSIANNPALKTAMPDIEARARKALKEIEG